jgi:FkbM family methyltransferase
MASHLARILLRILFYLGRPLGGIRPYRIYNYLSRVGFKYPEYNWYRDRWGNEMYLSPFYYQDRFIIAVGTYDLAINNLIENIVKTGMVCMDIGANIGHMTLHLARKVGISGKVFAFEPLPHIYQKLQNNIKRNSFENIVSAYELALSNQTGMATIGYADNMTENQGMGSLVNIKNDVVKYQRQIQTKTIDEFVREMKIRRLDFLKIDIQGAEILLLDGGKEVFSSLSPDLVIEISPIDLACCGNSPHDLIEILINYKYKIYEIKANGNIGKQLTMNEFKNTSRLFDVYCTAK